MSIFKDKVLVGKLTVHQDCKLIVASEVLDVPVAFELSYQVVEVVAIKEV